MSLLTSQMSSTQQDQSVDGESFSASKTAKMDPVVEAWIRLEAGTTLAIRGACVVRRSRTVAVSVLCGIQDAISK
jgi:hypothetical protein